MMRIDGMQSMLPNVQTEGMNGDAKIRYIQKQIKQAEEELKEIDKDTEMSLDEKSKKKQEINQKIADLQKQLKQNEIEKNKKQQSKKEDETDTERAETYSKKGTKLMRAGVELVISEDSLIKQAEMKGNTEDIKEEESGKEEEDTKL